MKGKETCTLTLETPASADNKQAAEIKRRHVDLYAGRYKIRTKVRHGRCREAKTGRWADAGPEGDVPQTHNCASRG